MKNGIRILMVFLSGCLAGCGGQQYNVDYMGSKSSFKGAKDRYAAGSEVELYYDQIGTDTDYSFYLDGERLNPFWDQKKGYIIRFTMPEHNITLEVKAVNSMYALEQKDDLRITITAGDIIVSAVLYDNEAGRAFRDMLPITLQMQKMNEREFCYQLGGDALPAEETEMKRYEIGDISYLPSKGLLVISYAHTKEEFEQQPVGYIENNISFFADMPDMEFTFETGN